MLLELNVSCLRPDESVTVEATMPAFLKAVADCDAPLPAVPIAAFKAAVSVLVSVTPDRFTDTFTRVESEKPGPWK